MLPETDYLKRIAEEIAANKDYDKHRKVDLHLEQEAKRLEHLIRKDLLNIDNFVRRDTFHFDTLVKLVDICDVLFDINQTVGPNVVIILNLLTAVKQIIPAEIRPNLRLPKAFVESQKPIFTAYWESNFLILQQQGVDPALIDIAAIPFAEFTDPKHKLYWGNYTWLTAYQRKLEAMDWENADCNSKTEALVSLLIGSGLNHDRFFIYCKDIIQDRTGKKTGRKEKLKELAFCRKLVLQDARAKSVPYKYRVEPLITQLLVWITAEEEYVNIHEPEQPFARLSFQFYQHTLAFFFKLLHEQKVFGDISFRELSAQVASTCTAMGSVIPSGAMAKKAYPKKQIDFKRMEALLISMLEYLRRFM